MEAFELEPEDRDVGPEDDDNVGITEELLVFCMSHVRMRFIHLRK